MPVTGTGVNWPVAYASIPTSGAKWLGATPGTFECTTNVNDPADGFTITDASVTGNGSSSSPYLLTALQTYNFNVTVNGSTAGNVYWAIWFDENGDGDFTDAEDQFRTGTTAQNAGATTATSQSITIPDAPVGTTTGRVRVVATAVNPTFTKAMNGAVTLTNGEVEDYYVIYSSTLPLTLTAFNADKKGNDGLLTWTTATELNTKNFVVENSSDGKTYKTIGIVTAAGNSNHTLQYSFTHNQPNGTNYYRLKMVDFDGAYTNSAIRVLNFGTATKAVVVYPNPTKGRLTVTGIEDGTTIKILDVQGRILKQVIAAGSTKDVDISNLATGIYLVQMGKQGVAITTIRVVKN